MVRQHPALLSERGRRPLAPAGLAAAFLIAWGYLSRYLPAPPVRADILLSSAVVLGAVAVFVHGLLPLRALGRRLPLLALAALPLAALFVWLGQVPLANVCKVMGAAALGLWIAAELEQVSWIVLVAVLSAAVDAFSVAAGPTKVLLDQGPVLVGYFVVGITWLGYPVSVAYTALGVPDIIFFSLYTGACARFHLRLRATMAAMVVSFVLTIAAAMWFRALPALPLLSAAFLLANADLLWARLRRTGGSS